MTQIINLSLAILLLLTFLTSCESPTESAKAKGLAAIRTYAEFSLKKVPEIKSLDSIYIVRWDTLTQKDELTLAANYAYNETTRLLEKAKISLQIAKHSQNIADLGASLYGGQVNRMEQEAAAEDRQKAAESRNEAQAFLKSADSLMLLSKDADSVNFRYYKAKCLLQITNKDMSLVRDTMYMILSSDFRIVKDEELVEKYFKK